MVGPNSGVQYIAQILIPFTVAEFLQPKASVKLVSVSKPNAKQKNGARASQNENNVQPKSLQTDAAKLAVSSLTCLAGIFKSSGTFLRSSVHKNIQCILIGLCSEMQAEKSTFVDPEVRLAIYNTLLEVLVSHHPKGPVPLRIAIKLFQQGSICYF